MTASNPIRLRRMISRDVDHPKTVIHIPLDDKPRELPNEDLVGQLGHESERLERAIAATRDGVWDWPSVESDQMWWSPMCFRLLGYEPGEIESKLSVWMSLIHPEDQLLVKKSTFPHQDQCFVDVHREFEYRMRHKSGIYRWYEHRTLVEYDERGCPRRMVGSVADIQIRKDLEQSLREQVQQRDNFLAILSHELRNPINAIKNANQLRAMLHHTINDSAISCTDEVIRIQIEHISRILDDLLDASRMIHNKLELRLTRFDLRETVKHVSDALKPSIDARGIKLSFILPDKAIPVFADFDRIVQCQMNLLNNALKFSNLGGRNGTVISNDRAVPLATEREFSLESRSP